MPCEFDDAATLHGDRTPAEWQSDHELVNKECVAQKRRTAEPVFKYVRYLANAENKTAPVPRLQKFQIGKTSE